MDIYDKSNNILIISLPYNLKDIESTIRECILYNFNNESLLFCIHFVLQFLNPNKRDIQSKISGSMTKLNTKENKCITKITEEDNSNITIASINDHQNDEEISSTSSSTTSFLEDIVDLEYDKSHNKKWSIEKHDELIETEAILVINPSNHNYISIPRNVNNLQYQWGQWQIRWNQMYYINL